MGTSGVQAVPLQSIGSVPYRPLGQSHFIPAPWQTTADTPYQPAAMCREAMWKGVLKSLEPLREFPEELANKMQDALAYHLSGIWAGPNTTEYAEAVSLLNLDKSPGFPYYYDCEDKADSLDFYGNDIQAKVRGVLAGVDEWTPFTLTLKDELRTADRVKANKTRVFSASNIVHLLVGKVLFTQQELKLRATLGHHPVTIGVGVPGPQFVSTVLSLGEFKNVYHYDVGGCDQKFPLRVARNIRNVRRNHTEPSLRAAVDWYYDSTYAGYVVCEGRVYVQLHNKSGHELTGDDTSLFVWNMHDGYVMDVTGCQPAEVDKFYRLIQNGDDGAVAYFDGQGGPSKELTGPGFRDWCARYGVTIELESDEPRYAWEGTFLSHTLRDRYIPKLGDCVVAAGNRLKLQSSIQWLRWNSEYALEESSLMHLIGLRINLWPWKNDFDDLEELIDDYVSKIELTPKIRNILKARIPESHIVALNFRYEDGFEPVPDMDSFFSVFGRYGVDPEIISAIFEVEPQMGKKTKVTQAEKKRRAHQSAMDKGKSKSKNHKQEKVNTGSAKETKHTAPAAQAFTTATAFRVGPSKRFKDGICIEGADHLEYVVVPSNEQVGGVLNEIYINPSELGGTRLEKYASLYEKYMFEKLDFEYLPAVGSSQPGSIVLAYDRDISDPTPSADENGVRQYTAYEGAKDGNVWTKIVCANKLQAPDSGYYTNPVAGGDDRLSYQGQFYVATTVPTGAAAGTTLGRVRMHYKLHLFVPQLENSLLVAGFAGHSSTEITGSGDFFSQIINGAQQAAYGFQKWKPLLDSLGKYYVQLDPGLYKYNATITPSSNTATTTNGGTACIYEPTLKINENLPSSAPQPWVTLNDYVAPVEVAGDDWFGASSSGYIGVPRGGGKLYMDYSMPSTTGTDEYLLDLQRLGGFVNTFPTISNAFGIRRGIEACANRPDKMPPRVRLGSRATPGKTYLAAVTGKEKVADSSLPVIPTSALPRALDPCRYCGDEKPDHLGRNCPLKVGKAPDSREFGAVLTSLEAIMQILVNDKLAEKRAKGGNDAA